MMMKILILYVPLGVSLLSLASIAVLGVMWSRRVDSLLDVLPTQERNPDLHFRPMMIRALRLAEHTDGLLAAQMRRIFHAQIVSFISFLAFGVFALVMGSRMIK
jgi:hypothetical protein